MKKILAMLLALTMVLCMIPASVIAVSTNAVTLTVTPEKTVVHPGDTVTFTVSMQQTGKMTSLESTILLPDGLTLVEGSMSVVDKSVLGWDDMGMNEAYLLISGFGSVPYAGTESVNIATFQCTVDSNASGALTVTLDPDEAVTFAGDENYDYKDVAIVGATVKVEIPVTGVSLNKNSLSLKTGESETLVATVAPETATNKNLTWESNATSVATVDSTGKVEAIKEGTATITVTTADGSFSASCTVVVACSHANKTETPADEPDCVNPGNNKYYTCDACGDVFKADGVTETTVAAETISALNHDFTERIEDAAHLVSGTGANCQDVKEYYFDCSRCNVMGTTTFASTTYGAHQMSNQWTTANGEHYHKCTVTGCTYVEDRAACSGGAATCTQKAVCSTCTKEYGQLLQHDLTHYAPNGATHFQPGNIEYWQCEDCLQYFRDASAENKITQADTVIEQIRHSHSSTWSQSATQHWNECSCGDKINLYDHVYDNSCDTTCNTCGYIRTIAHTWNTQHSYNADQHWIECSICHEKKELADHTGGTATCQVKKQCTVCLQSYGDLGVCDFTAEKAEQQYQVSEATCNSKAVYNKSCTVCGTKGTATFEYGEVNADNHVGETELKEVAAASCTEAGYTGDTWCKDCNTKIEDGEPILATAHATATAVTEQAATCKDTGVKAHFHCPVCNMDFLEKTVEAVPQTADDLKLPVNANNHKGETELKDAAPASCTEPGYTGDTWCKDCNTKIADGEPIPAGHTYGETHKYDDSKHWKECACGDKTEEADHTYGEWVTTKKPSTTAEGSRERECSVCDYKQTEAIPVTTTPQTGDNSQLGLMLALFVISACGLVTMLFLVPQKKGKYQR